jgi:hypothetical protein
VKRALTKLPKYRSFTCKRAEKVEEGEHLFALVCDFLNWRSNELPGSKRAMVAKQPLRLTGKEQV